MFDASCSFKRKDCCVKVATKKSFIKITYSGVFYVQLEIEGGELFMYND